jgi:hypothetical protein
MTILESPDFTQSTYRERLVEYLFVGEVLRHLWKRGVHNVEVLKPAVAHSGYDLVLEHNQTIRHIELKASNIGGKRRAVTVNVGLQSAPSGCVIWINVNPDNLELKPFWWFGNAPGTPLPSIEGLRLGKQTRGYKRERASIRSIPRSKFTRLDTIAEVVQELFGDVEVKATYNSGPQADG